MRYIRDQLSVVFAMSVLSSIGCDLVIEERADELEFKTYRGALESRFERAEVSAERYRLISSGVISSALDGSPVAHAEIALIGTLVTAETDERGRYEVPARLGFHWISVEADGWIRKTAHLGADVALWPRDPSEVEVRRYLDERARPPLDHDPLDDPDLTERARDLIQARRAAATHPASTHEYFDHIVDHFAPDLLGSQKSALTPPETVRIYRRGDEDDSCVGRVDVIPLEDYVRGVVPHEWIPSWEHESLRAGAIAARSYVWGWVLAGGKYNCADLDDTTRSQVYRDARDERGDRAVMTTTGMGIERDGALVTSEYSAENGDPTAFGVSEPLCAGEELFGHGRGMCQWGTQRWARQRQKTAEWMVAHYFPDASASHPSAPRPNLNLEQRLERVTPQECLDAEGSFGCLDFVRQGWSVGVFDLFTESVMTYTLIVNNTGSVDASGVEVAITLPVSDLAIDAISSGGQVIETASGVEISFDEVNANASVEIELRLRGAGYSPASGGPAAIRSWVREIEGLYRKATWESPASENEGQTFNGGDLRALAEVDVFDHRTWRWLGEATLWDGWFAQRDVLALAASSRGLGVTVRGEQGGVLDSPLLPNFPREFVEVIWETTPPIGARLWWRGAGASFEPEHRIELSPGVNRLSGLELIRDPQQLRLELEGSTTIHRLVLNDASETPGGAEAGESVSGGEMLAGQAAGQLAGQPAGQTAGQIAGDTQSAGTSQSGVMSGGAQVSGVMTRSGSPVMEISAPAASTGTSCTQNQHAPSALWVLCLLLSSRIRRGRVTTSKD